MCILGPMLPIGAMEIQFCSKLINVSTGTTLRQVRMGASFTLRNFSGERYLLRAVGTEV